MLVIKYQCLDFKYLVKFYTFALFVTNQNLKQDENDKIITRNGHVIGRGLIHKVNYGGILTKKQVGVEHVDGTVFPRILTVQVYCVEYVLDKYCDYYCQENGILQ